jgi:GMP synthase-like glutamine amidotransferase
LTQHGINFEVHNAGLGQTFPASIEPYAALAVMGGGMSANDDLLSNRQAEILILQAVLRDVPVIGHCLGGQLMSRALGATVGTSPRPEIGWQSIQYETHAEVEKWFGSAPTPTVIQWHYDAFTVPRGATRLAGSSACPNQAWSMGPHLAMQFHIEMDAEKAQAWAADEDPKWAQARELYKSVQDSAAIVAGIEPYLAQHQATADHIYTTWLRPTEWVRAL